MKNLVSPGQCVQYDVLLKKQKKYSLFFFNLCSILKIDISSAK